jgi:hypothetical protein
MATRRPVRFSRTASAAAAATVLVLLSGCSGADDHTSADSGGDGSGGSVARASSADEAQAADVAQLDQGAPAAGEGGAPVEQLVISTGNVELRSDDVADAVFDARKVADAHGGTVAEDDTQTDRDGEPVRSRMVLRIPTAEFDAAMSELERVGSLMSSKRQTADVTTEVLDIDVRVEAQQRSIDRIQVLFDNATSIKDVVAVEGELSRRQADLASLQAQQRYLADQTSMSTITLTVERTEEQADEGSDDAGFLAGLEDGWQALEGFLVGASTVAGALLPWSVLALVLAVPGWPLLRRLRRRTPAVG